MDVLAAIHLTLHFLFSFLPVLNGMSSASSNFRVSRQLESLRQHMLRPRCRDPANVFTSHTPTNSSRVFIKCSNLMVTCAKSPRMNSIANTMFSYFHLKLQFFCRTQHVGFGSGLMKLSQWFEILLCKLLPCKKSHMVLLHFVQWLDRVRSTIAK